MMFGKLEFGTRDGRLPFPSESRKMVPLTAHDLVKDASMAGTTLREVWFAPHPSS